MRGDREKKEKGGNRREEGEGMIMEKKRIREKRRHRRSHTRPLFEYFENERPEKIRSFRSDFVVVSGCQKIDTQFHPICGKERSF